MSIYALAERQPRFESSEWFVAPGATVIGSVLVGHQTNVWFNAVIRADAEAITLGERTNVQDGAVLHADPGFPLVLGAGVTVGHKAVLHGCRIGDASLIGINAVVLNGATVGAGSILGAGALLAEGKSIPEGVLALGAPARVVRALTPREQGELVRIAAEYVQRAARYRAELALLPGH